MEKQAPDLLLIEDNPDDAKLAIRILRKSNIANHLLHLKDGEEAISYLSSLSKYKAPKLILLDIKMPKIDGLEVLRKVKSNPALNSTVVVILTSSGEEKDIADAYEAGVNAYLVKPVEFAAYNDMLTKAGYFWMTLNQIPK
ncbi:response regulator [uncultured Imperialibacter sp.]|uniref:response regulator n=1 Tax=uncultured Imperialibacter sp. TaxID=1672639 RepID=UPI0030D90A6F|tara:strand:- start:2055 stop:2477 length:423 start_codon:yes stop_codon:yes gene_type:complete